MNEVKAENYKFSLDWEKSSKYSYEQGLYKWLANDLISYDYIIEFGCGTGYSTLTLLEQGNKVLAIDTNEYCLSKAYEIIMKKGYKAKIFYNMEDLLSLDYDVIFLNFDFEGDISFLKFNLLHTYKVCCLHWNPSRNIENQILDNLNDEKNPNDDIENQIFNILDFSKKNQFDVQLCDRSDIKDFYLLLKQDYNYNKLDIRYSIFKYDNSGKKLISYGGINPSLDGTQKIININYIKGHFKI